MIRRRSMLAALLFAATLCPSSGAAETAPQRVLLIWQSPDGHPQTTHEYETGISLIANWLQKNTPHQVIVSKADSPWAEGPGLLDHADAVVMFVSQGAKWIREDDARLKAFQRLAQRGGGLSVLHWGMGTRQAADVADFVKMFGACHGGPDRKYKFLTTDLRVAGSSHPIRRGLTDMKIEDEFYYALKTVKPTEKVVPIVEANIDGDWQTVSWAYERPDGGRSFGFSGLHFHRNWKQENYRRLVFQGILWTLHDPIPENGIAVDIDPHWLELPDRSTTKAK